MHSPFVRFDAGFFRWRGMAVLNLVLYSIWRPSAVCKSKRNDQLRRDGAAECVKTALSSGGCDRRLGIPTPSALIERRYSRQHGVPRQTLAPRRNRPLSPLKRGKGVGVKGRAPYAAGFPIRDITTGKTPPFSAFLLRELMRAGASMFCSAGPLLAARYAAALAGTVAHILGYDVRRRLPTPKAGRTFPVFRAGEYTRPCVHRVFRARLSLSAIRGGREKRALARISAHRR